MPPSFFFDDLITPFYEKLGPSYRSNVCVGQICHTHICYSHENRRVHANVHMNRF
jgi:hypothetical protein